MRIVKIRPSKENPALYEWREFDVDRNEYVRTLPLMNYGYATVEAQGLFQKGGAFKLTYEGD